MTTTTPGPQDFVLEGLTIAMQAAADRLNLQWIGRSGAREPSSTLLPYLEKALKLAGEKHVPVALHLEKTDFVNSSTLAVVMRLVRLAALQKVKVILCYDETVLWQRLAFRPMAVLGRDSGPLELQPVGGASTGKA